MASLVNLLVKLKPHFLYHLGRSRMVAIHEIEALDVYFLPYEGILAALDSKVLFWPLKSKTFSEF